MDLLRLSEFEEREVLLSEDQVACLRERFPHALEILPAGSGRYYVRAGHFAGVISLDDIDIRIDPKVHVGSLFYMLSYSYGLADFMGAVAGYERIDRVWDFLLLIFATETERLIQRGVRRGYIEEQERLRTLRGRFLFHDHVRRPPGRELVIPCRFEEFTADLPHNQVIRYALDRIGRVRDASLRRRLNRLKREFTFATLRRFRPSDLESFEYDRLSAHYRLIHALCRILLEARGLDQPSGSYPSGTFLVDMNLLFERFMASWLNENLPSGWTLRVQEHRSLDVANRIRVRMDLCLAHEDEIRIVADTKYKPSHDASGGIDAAVLSMGGGTSGSKVAPHDVYQVLAYCRALEIRSGVLLYPDWNGPAVHFRISDGANDVIADGVDLGMPPEYVEVAMDGLVKRLVQLTGHGEPVGAVSA